MAGGVVFCTLSLLYSVPEELVEAPPDRRTCAKSQPHQRLAHIIVTVTTDIIAGALLGRMLLPVLGGYISGEEPCRGSIPEGEQVDSKPFWDFGAADAATVDAGDRQDPENDILMINTAAWST
ncbi:hypothetical protein F4777DRAFT_583390 [Nemania sp. FL0916]|nr:hypothetical protein F4777DRAFT_583390 [Nemania sp. FL0916]